MGFSLFKKIGVIGIIILFLASSVLPMIKGIGQSSYDEVIENVLQNKERNDLFGFDIYENNKDNNIIPLIINSDLMYSTFLGGNDTEKVYDIKVDTNRYTYITGSTQSSDFPTTSGAYDTTLNGTSDAFITKLSPSGDILIYSTFLGGTNEDQCSGIVVDANGYIYITGETYSSDFPTTSGAYDNTLNGDMDVFVTKLSPSGTLVYSTFLGGTDNDYGMDIKVDANGYVYINGVTYSNDFPTTSGAYDTTYNDESDAFITKLSPSGNTLVYSTYLGGADSDLSYDITVDTNGYAYINGVTWSCNFPKTSQAYDTTYNGGSDGFITKLSQSGDSLIYSTYLGGIEDDFISDILADANGCYIIGLTYSNDFPTTSGAYDIIYNGGGDVFVTKLSTLGETLVFSTFLGGTSFDQGTGITLDANWYICITGETRSSDFPITPETYDATINGSSDVFVTKFSPSGDTLIYSTYLGGTNNDYLSSIDLDINGDSYITGITKSYDFPSTSGAYDTTYNGGDFDVFVAKFYLNDPPNTPTNPDPFNGETNVDVNAILFWTCTDPDGDDLTYDVYFGIHSNPPLVSYGQSQIYYDPPSAMYFNRLYYWKIVAEDEYGVSTASPIWNFTTSSIPNDPPNIPSDQSPMDGATDVNLNTLLTWTCNDPDDDDIVYKVFFEENDSTPDVLVSDNQDGTIFNPGILFFETTYYWQIIAKDEHGASTPGPIWHFTTTNLNNPPSAPTITGPNGGKPGTSYEYTFNAVDPDGDQVKYLIEWGDGKTNTTALNPSGSNVKISHSWSTEGTYIIKAKAQDSNGLTGPETTKTVNMPRNRTMNIPFLNFLENHPNLFLFLQKLLNK